MPKETPKLEILVGMIASGKSGYASKRARALYPEPKWTFIDKTMRKNINQQAARTKYHGPPKEAPETLIVNGPEFK